MSVDIRDFYGEDEISNCCGHAVLNPAGDEHGICTNCGEWCEVEKEEE